MRPSLPVFLLLAVVSPALAQSGPAPQSFNEFSSIDAVAEPDPSAVAGLFPQGAPNLLAPESMATSYRLPSADTKVPTGLKYSDGDWQYEVGTNVKTNSPSVSIIPQIPDPRVLGGAAGGSGEVKGQLRPAEGQWELFGAQRFGMTDSERPVAQDSTTFGSAYLLPDWLAGGKIAASVELAPSDERKTRLEYRQKFGPAEAFVGAEQTFQPHQTDPKSAPTAVRGGVARKF
ncbi:MAG TPA: hypothetical protein VH765_09380 [Xanthobacteraceae bacterium]|jgi:hypothetical protein